MFCGDFDIIIILVFIYVFLLAVSPFAMAMGRLAGVAVSVSEELEDTWKPRPRTAGPTCLRLSFGLYIVSKPKYLFVSLNSSVQRLKNVYL